MKVHVTFVLGDLSHFGGPYNGSFAHGIASMTAVLRRAGVTVNLIHLTRLPTREAFLARLQEQPPDLLAFSSITHMFPHVQRWAQWAKETQAVPVLVGGVHAILRPEEVIASPHVDYVCTGEGEHTLLALCRALDRGAPVVGIPGLWTKSNGVVHRAPQRPLIEDLNTLPQPDYSVFDYEQINHGLTPRLSVMLSRGCPYRCSYCSNQRIKNSYPNPRDYTRFYSVDRALKLLVSLMASYPETREIIFNDNILYPDMPWLREFAPKYRDLVGVPFTANTRPNLVDEEVVELLRLAGCRRICMGVENGDERIANRVLRRGQNNAVIRKAFRLFRRVGIDTVSYNIVGAPFETMGTMVKTVRLNAELRPTMLSPFIYYPFPGTESYEMCEQSGFLTSVQSPDNLSRVMIRQATVTEDEVLFMHRYFRPLVRSFQLLDAFPGPLGSAAKSGLSRMLESGWIPYRPLVHFKEMVEKVRLRAVS